MISDDLLTSIRTQLTHSREDLTNSENMQIEYEKKEPTVFKNDVEDTSKSLINNL